MSLELVDTLATLGTFIVIAATATAAIIQLRHARSSNQIAALNTLMEVQQTQEFKVARHFVHTELAGMLQDPAFRRQLWLFVNEKGPTVEAEHQIAKVSTLGDFYENLGLLVKRGFVDRVSALDVWSYAVSQEWERLEPIVLRYRRAAGDAIYENFEYLAVLSQDWIAAHPNGAYPAGIRRIKLRDDPWLEADKEYAASLALYRAQQRGDLV
jgi:hypothetical protein